LLIPLARSQHAVDSGVHMKPIFWTGTANHISDYLIHNKRLRDLSNRFPLYVVYSGTSEYLKTYYPKATIIKCENEWMKKAVRVHEAICLRSEYDVVIRFCPDTIIKDVDTLIRMIETAMAGNPMMFVGNVAKFKGITYLRGACNSTPRAVFEKLVLKPSDTDYDTWYSTAVVAAGGVMKDVSLFEINNKYTGKLPVWHPTQYDIGHRDMKVRFKTFLAEC
jgi:hypothetical protein